VSHTLLHGDCLDVLRTLPSASVDAVVTDPPYGLSFMGKRWDYDVPSVEVWQECLRVLKPGGHLLAFAGTRTQHRMAVRIEDAGFEIRDMIAWVYGSGFPKSLDVSKAIDKAAGAEREVVGSRVADDIRGGNMHAANRGERHVIDITAPATDAARQWQGWGTALKPALEPITVARKPLAGTVAANVLEHGTGALNVDGCRVGTDKIVTRVSGGKGFGSNFRDDGWLPPSESYSQTNSGRWPANLIHDGSDEVVRLFPQQSSGSRSAGVRKGMGFHGADGDGGPAIQGSSGSAARFFYCAKANKRDRGEGNNHPTVKPTDLMRYLCRLVTPPGGVVLDPFMGSGSTGKAAVSEGFRFIGIEREAEYLEIARRRIVEPDSEASACQQGLF
jgi:site-specific DNA-methyltransferase (adenine-specific)